MAIVHIIVAVLAVVIIGMLVGVVARLLMPGRLTLSPAATAAVGVVGSVIGAFVIWYTTGITEIPGSVAFLGAVAGSMVVLGLCRVYHPQIVTRRSTSA